MNQCLGIELNYKEIAFSSTLISVSMAFCIHVLDCGYSNKYAVKTKHTKLKWMEECDSDADIWNKKQARKWLKQRLNTSDTLKNFQFSFNLLEFAIYPNNTHEMIVQLNVSTSNQQIVDNICSQLKCTRLRCKHKQKNQVYILILKFLEISPLPISPRMENCNNSAVIRYVSCSKDEAPAGWCSGIIVGLGLTVISVLKFGDNIVFNLMVKDASRSRPYDDGHVGRCIGAILGSTLLTMIYQSIKGWRR